MPHKVLVTGACGFIGSHLVEALAERGYEVTALVQYNSFNTWGWLDDLAPEVIEKVDVRAGDIRDSGFVESLVRGHESVIHLAALIAIPYSYTAAKSYVDTNVHGTLNILQSTRNCGVKKLIHTSTSEVYGTAQYVPIDELHPLGVQSPYAASKSAADQLAQSFAMSFDLPVVILRPFNTYGPRQSARAVIPTVITQLASGSREISMGNVLPTRDFNYVADTVNAFCCTLESDNGLGKVINIGSNFEISIEEMVFKIAEMMGVDVTILSDESRIRPGQSEVKRLYSSNKLAREILGWTPKYGGQAGFERGLEKTIAWFSCPANLGRYRPHQYNI